MIGTQINVVTYDKQLIRNDHVSNPEAASEHPQGWNKIEFKPDGSIEPLLQFSDQADLDPIWIINERNQHWNLVVERPSLLNTAIREENCD